MEISEDQLMELARISGLPVSWWDKAKREGKEPPAWRELRLFADMIQKECVMALINLQNGYDYPLTDYNMGRYAGVICAIDKLIIDE